MGACVCAHVGVNMCVRLHSSVKCHLRSSFSLGGMQIMKRYDQPRLQHPISKHALPLSASQVVRFLLLRAKPRTLIRS